MMNEEEAVATLDQWDELHRVGWQRGTKDQCEELDQLDDLYRNGWQRNKTEAKNRADASSQSLQRRNKVVSRLFLAIMILAAAYFASEYLFSVELGEIPSYPSTLQIRIAKEENTTRRLSTGLPDGGCTITPQKFAEKDISPTYQASFPGSGARMTWNLVIALTGIAINDDHNHAGVGYDRVVAVKTHYPLDYGRYIEDDAKFRGAILLLRNPMTAVPSFFNFKYEQKNRLPNHSTRAPTEDWIKFRDSNLESQLKEYQSFVTYWMEKYDSREKLLIVTYEDLIDNDEGPIAASKIAGFLGQTEGVEPISREYIPCVWHAVVKYKEVAVSDTGVNSKERGRKLLPSNPDSLRMGPTERPYNSEQLELLKTLVEGLMEKFSTDGEFVAIMSSYLETISSIEALD